MKTLKDFAAAVNLRTLSVSAISILATVFCIERGIFAEIPISLIGLSVVFPVVFTIGASFRRRDVAIEQYGKLSANLSALYMISKFHQDNDEETINIDLVELRKIINGLFEKIQFDIKDTKFSSSNKTIVYEQYNKLFNKVLPLNPLYPSVSFFLTDTITAYETLSGISDYRTPVALKAYSKIFMTIFPIIFAPYFASLSNEFFLVGIAVSFFYSVALLTLSNIQDDIENPFDGQGLDDLKFDRENRFLYCL